MFEFHGDVNTYFEHQAMNSKKNVLPMLQKHVTIDANAKVMEVGCGEAGVLRPFCELGCTVVGIDLAVERIANANKLMSQYVSAGKAQFLVQDFYEEQFLQIHGGTFDAIILKDVIEHLPNQEVAIGQLKKYLKPGVGKLFFGFPPWQMPFGGHQQVCKNKWLSRLPYYHLLPWFAHKGLLKIGGETDSTLVALKEVKDTGISIERFERCVKTNELQINERVFFLFNPIYEYKFGVQARKQYGFISALPWLRNFLTTCMYYVVG